MKKIIAIVSLITAYHEFNAYERPNSPIQDDLDNEAMQILERDVAAQQIVDQARQRRQQENQPQQFARPAEGMPQNHNRDRFEELLHRRAPNAGHIGRRGNLRGRNLMQEFNQAGNNQGQEFQIIEFGPDVQIVPVAPANIVINAQNRLREIRGGVFVIQNNIAEVPEYQEPQGFQVAGNIN